EQGLDDEIRMGEWEQRVRDPGELDDEVLEITHHPPRIHQWLAGTDLVRISTSEPATSTPMVPTTMRWIHCLAASADLDSAAVIFHKKAKMNASAPIEPTRAWPMWIHVLMRFVIGVMSGAESRKSMRTSRRFEPGD